MYEALLDALNHIPAPYESTGLAFWEEEHISASMLAAHLEPGRDGASRPHQFIDRSARWIASLPEQSAGTLLDLGCGPGLYAERFHDLGLRVTGLDISPRSIAHAKDSARRSGRVIDYHCESYLDMAFVQEFALATLIYCDFGVLPPGQRAQLLRRAYRALQPGGLLVLDSFTPAHYADFRETLTAEHQPGGGFWSGEPYLCLKSTRAYPEQTYLERYTVVSGGALRCYNLWNHAFSPEELRAALEEAGFAACSFFGDAAGARLTPESPTLCAVARKIQRIDEDGTTRSG